MVMATSAEVDWRIAAAAVAAAAEVPVAIVVVGATVADDDPVRPHVAGVVDLPGADQLGLEQARDLVLAVRRAFGAVLVAAPAGLLVTLGRDDWRLADLAAAVGAAALVVTGPGPDAVNHTTLTLGALAGHGISASVITLGDGLDEAALPVTPIGRIPADRPDDLAGAAEWFHPALLVTAAPAEPPILAGRPAVSGRKFVLVVLAVFAVMIFLACGAGWLGMSTSDEASLKIEQSPRQPAYTGPAFPVPIPAVPRPAQPAVPVAEVCPQNAGQVTVSRPDRATTARVDQAWTRIERWLRAHAPASARALRPGASAARIDELQRRMSVAFPPDLVASLRRHDGVADMGFALPPFYLPESVDRIFGDWQVNCSVTAELGGRELNGWWHRGFVPFAADGSGGNLVVDQRPGGHGRVGETDPESGSSFERWPASVAELLESTAKALETGKPYAGHYRPQVTAEQTLDWEIV
jgi:cell wall assembly regulator SMI1